MKKLVLIMVFVLLMALFIAFNYLLWDRESKVNELKSLEYNNASYLADITSQSRDIKRLENENNEYISDISKLEKEKEQLAQKNLQLESDKNQETGKTGHKIDIINILKQSVDIKLFGAVVEKWVEAVSTGNYPEAYRLEYDKASLQSKQPSLEDYTNALKSNVKSIKLKELILEKEQGKAEGEIILKAALEVKLTEKPEQDFTRFADGLNEMKFKLDYDAALNEFYILEITE